jgi:hypothetical protein
MRPRASVYIDGFNLYYGLRRRAKAKGIETQWRWLNLGKLAQFLLPEYEIGTIHYFTARVKGRPDDPSKVARQNTFLRALATLPNLQVHFGYYQESTVSQRREEPCAKCGDRFASVLRTEEKGSDVNLARLLLVDAYEEHCKAAALLSNDSDLALPVAQAAKLLPNGVIVFNPHPGKTARRLRDVASDYRAIKDRTLRATVFDDELEDGRGRIVKPEGW